MKKYYYCLYVFTTKSHSKSLKGKIDLKYKIEKDEYDEDVNIIDYSWTAHEASYEFIDYFSEKSRYLKNGNKT